MAIRFTSEIRRKEHVITDANASQFAQDFQNDAGHIFKRGYQSRDRSKMPYGKVGAFSAKFDLPVIPRSRWTDMIRGKERDKTRLTDIRRRRKMKSLDQDGTNFCWGNGPVNCVRMVRAMDNQQDVDLSPASICAPIKRYRNQGGWGSEALKYIVEHGICPSSLWPANYYRNAQYDTPESREARKAFKVLRWYDLAARSFDQLMTCVLLNIPVAIGLNWWTHEVEAQDGVVLGPDRFGIRIWNSWTDEWGDEGESVLTEAKARPDDACAPIMAVAA